MKQLCFVILMLQAYHYCSAQNLVVNGNIETDSCSTYWYEGEITGWDRHYPAQHIHYGCTYIGELTEHWLPMDGRGAIGIYSSGFNAASNGDSIKNRGYVIGSLSKPLVADQEYLVSYWVKPCGYGDKIWNYMTSDQISLAFVDDISKVADYDDEGNWVEIYNFEPDVVNPHGILYNYDQYIKIEDCYVADGTERYFIMGDFEEFGKTNLDTLMKNREDIPVGAMGWFSDRSYILIDNVAVYEVPDLELPDTTICSDEALTLYKDDFMFDEIFVNADQVLDSIILDNDSKHNIEGYWGSCYRQKYFEVSHVSCKECDFYIPNVISANSQDTNNQMMIGSNCDYTIRSCKIYNRWGNLIYQSEGSLDWDGSYQNLLVESGVYVYEIELQIHRPQAKLEKRITGSISFLK